MSTNLKLNSLINLSILNLVFVMATAKTIYILSSRTTFNPEYMQNSGITIKPDNLSIDMVYNVKKPFEPWLGVALKMKARNAKAFRTLLQYDFKLCYLLGKGSGKFLTSWVDNIYKYGNLPKTCSFVKGNYSWHDLKIENQNIPPFLAVALYEVRVDTYLKRRSKMESITNATVLFEIR